MEGILFSWGESLDEQLKYVKTPYLKEVCRKTMPYYPSVKDNRHKLYEIIASQEELVQRQIINKVQVVLSDADPINCTRNWILKRKQEDEDIYIRKVRAKLDNLNGILIADGPIGNLRKWTIRVYDSALKFSSILHRRRSPT